MLTRAATAASLVIAAGLALAGPAAAETVTVPGCATAPVRTPAVGFDDVQVPSYENATVCAFDSATVSVDADPVEESENCAYGPGIHVAGPAASVDGVGIGVYYTADGQPSGGPIHQPPVVVDVETDTYDSGPLWNKEC